MNRLGTGFVLVALAAVTFVITAESAPPLAVEKLVADFERYSGAKLVFAREALPPGTYHDILLPLAEDRRLKAATIALREIQKYPPRFLERIGLEAIGIFEACASREGDGYRPYDKALGGYRYFGIWNGASGVAAAYYTDQQLPLTIHHEVFHHVDGARGNFDPAKHFAGDDANFNAVLAGTHRYPPLVIEAKDRERLRKTSRGQTLEAAVSDYASKNPGEDQAETARYLLSHLPDALLQAAERPELPGSQRILHVLGEYAAAVDGAATPAWFTDIALGRSSTHTGRREPRTGKPTVQAKPTENPLLVKVDAAIGAPKRRAAIRAVQPACVRVGQGSGVCITPEGMILTAAHVAGQLGNSLRCTFPDGREYLGSCVVINQYLDLALVDLHTSGLPTAPVAGSAPAVRSWVCCIGQPGQTAPSGEPTKYEAWHVSTGVIRGFLPDPLGPQALGRAKHDAWTYWGHSGSPLFNERGEIVALHNSWDSTTAMRHAVPHEAIVWFLVEAKLATPAAK